MGKIKIIQTADVQVKNRNQNLYRSYNYNLKEIENHVKVLEIPIFIISGDLFEYAEPTESERKLIYNHISRLLAIPTLKELVLIAGNHDLIKEKKETEMTNGHNCINIYSEMVDNLDKDKAKKLLYMSESRVYQSRVADKIQYLCYSLEDGMQTNFSDADPNKYSIVVFHDMIIEYVEMDKLPLRKDVKDALLSIDSFPSNSFIAAGDIHKRLRFDGLDGQVFYFPGSPQQHTHAEGHYFKIKEKVETKYAEQKALNLYTFNFDKEPIAKNVETDFIPLTNYVSYVTIDLDVKFPKDHILQNIDIIDIPFGAEQTFIKIKSSNIFVGEEPEIRGMINSKIEANDAKRVNISFDYEKFIQKENTSANPAIKDIIEKKIHEHSDPELGEVDTSEITVGPSNIDDLILSNDDIVRLFDSVLQQQLTKTNKNSDIPDNELTDDIIALFRKNIDELVSSTKRYNIKFKQVETSGFMGLLANRIALDIPGLTRILGTNGIGKTTLYTLIRWVITGEAFDGMLKSQASKNSLVVFNKNLPNQDFVHGQLEMDINGLYIVAERHVERKWKNNTTDEQKISIHWKDFIAKTERTFKLAVTDEKGETKNYNGEQAEKAILMWFGKTVDSILFLNQSKIETLLKNSSGYLNEMILGFIGVDYIKKLEEGLPAVKDELMTVKKPTISKDDILLKITDCKIFDKKFVEEMTVLEKELENTTIARDKLVEEYPTLNERLVKVGDIPEQIKGTETAIETLDKWLTEFETKEKKPKIPFEKTEPVKDIMNIDILTNHNKTHQQAITDYQVECEAQQLKINSAWDKLKTLITDQGEYATDKIDEVERKSDELHEQLKQTYSAMVEKLDVTITGLKEKLKENQDKNAEIQATINVNLKQYQTNQENIAGGVCDSCGQALGKSKEEFEEHKKHILADNEKLVIATDKLKEEQVPVKEMIEKIEKFIALYNTYRDKAVANDASLCNETSLQKSLGELFGSIANTQRAIDGNKNIVTDYANLIKYYNAWLPVEHHKYDITPSVEIPESGNVEELKNLIATHKTHYDNIEVMKFESAGETDKIAANNLKIAELEKEYNDATDLWKEAFKKNVADNEAIDVYNNGVDDHNKSKLTKEIDLANLKANLPELKGIKLEEYNTSKLLVDDNLEKQKQFNDSLETINGEIKTKGLQKQQNLNEKEKYDTLYADYIKYEKNNIIWTVYQKLIKSNFKDVIFEYYRTFLNNTLNVLLKDVAFKLFWNNDNELYMVGIKDGKTTYQPVQQSSGMETCFLGLALIYTMHLLNVKNTVSHLLIDEISGTLNKGKELTYEASDYQELLVLILNKFTDKSVFIIDHNIENLFETSMYEVMPEVGGAKYYMR